MTASGDAASASLAALPGSRLFRKYVALLVGLVSGVLIVSGGLSLYFLYKHEQNALAGIQHEKALAAAAVIRQFIEEIQAQIGWTTQLSLLPGGVGAEQRRLDYFRLLRQAPAITEIAFLDEAGREELRVSRLAMDAVGSATDFSQAESFRVAQATGVYFGPVYFRKESEPYMTLAVRGGGKHKDVTVAEINLKFIRDIVFAIRVGAAGYAYVVDAQNRLVAHPDLALVLRKTDLSNLAQVKSARARTGLPGATGEKAAIETSLDGRQVLTAHAGIVPLDWNVFVETPLSEAFAPLYTTLLWNAGLLLIGLVIAVLASLFLARSLVGPIQALQDGAARLGGGDLNSRITIATGDELQALAGHFNLMAEQLQAVYGGLEEKVEERTQRLARSVRELETLGEVSQAVNSTLDLNVVLGSIASHAVTLAEADAGAFCSFDEPAQAFNVQVVHGMEPVLAEVLARRPIRLGEGALGTAGQRRSAVQIDDIDREPGYALYDIVREPGYRALLAVPLLREKHLVGGLVICRKAPGAFPPDTVNLVQTLANQSVLAIHNARLFQEIEEKGRELAAASQHKSQFLANMSHELRTPLNAILGYTELITDNIYGEVPDKICAVLERVQHNGRHLLGLINAVLDLSKIEAGHLTLALGDYRIEEIVQNVVVTVESLAAEKNIALHVELHPELPTGRGDEQRITQVLLNLVGNAIKFSDAGNVSIDVQSQHDEFHVKVTDTGPGIDEQNRQHIFDEFQQADNSSTREKGGTGLGLAIAKKIVQMHGGEIGLASQLGEGSVFWFSLPVRVDEQREAA